MPGARRNATRITERPFSIDQSSFSLVPGAWRPASCLQPDHLLATTITAPTLESHDDIALADRLKAGHDQIIAELQKLIVGQEDVIELVLLSLFTGGRSEERRVGKAGRSRGWPKQWTEKRMHDG